MRKRWYGLIATVIALIFIGSQAPPAGATVAANGPWYPGKVMTQNAATSSPYCTMGPELYSPVTLHYYRAMPRHCFEPGGYGTGISTNGVGFAGVYNGDVNNWFDHHQIVLPNWPSWPGIDVVLVDIGTGSWPRTDDIWVYCSFASSFTNCTSFLGGGTSVNAWNDGIPRDVKGHLLSHDGWVVCKSGAISGTSCGTVTDENALTINQQQGYTSPVQRIGGLTDCNITGGDSGSVVYGPKLGESDGGVWVMGMIIAQSQTQITAGQGHPCYTPGKTFGVTMSMIDIIDIVSAFPQHQLWVVNWN